MHIIDTSVLIDGRIQQVCECGFLDNLVVPQFVLRELCSIADSEDAQRRKRGKLGLAVLQAITLAGINVQFIDTDYNDGTQNVDHKLVRLAKEKGYKLVTNDANLATMARIQKVRALNLNELIMSLKERIVQGDEISIDLVKEGKGQGQAIGFLDDGTLVVVDNGFNYIGTTVLTVVTGIIQTSAGRLVFCRHEEKK